ncbi:adipokinetic hormone/corazonin-related peptide receptor variant I-like [Argiope bruennichi]|uniref:adipokinetic hormone/corazonin-related peptide receptor variant I-like n=1 Tax=Argiope bruennichi TaxID=94029 RepID=UPI00249512B2|nr:adipokinetic hormone/corazonin-related peptide receptor variant I-like [Argiope bruennichi]
MGGVGMEIGLLDESYIDEYFINGSYNDSYNGSLLFPDLPYYLTFNEDSVREVVLYSLMFVLAAAGNIPVFVTLLRNRHRKSRVNLMILHLAIADLIVTFVMIPLEIAWRITVQWVAGNAACKILLYMRAFGPYLSSTVLVCISLDRYFAILYPLKVNDAQRRGKIMLGLAWAISILCSIPQSVIFHVETHPEYPQFIQCVSFNFFPTVYHKMAYNIFCLLAVYGVPLSVIIFCYSRILWEISRRSRDTDVSFLLADLTQQPQYRRRLCLRRSDIAQMERARARTLRMTIIIVLTFFWCWTPYVVMVLWYLFDPESADKVDSRVQSSLFMFAVSNSCVNPLVYGSYVLNFKDVFAKCCCKRPTGINASMSHTQITTPAKKVHFEGIQRDVSIHLNMNGTGTYPVLIDDVDIKDQSFPKFDIRPFRYSSSLNKLYSKEYYGTNSSQKVEVIIHSLDH